MYFGRKASLDLSILNIFTVFSDKALEPQSRVSKNLPPVTVKLTTSCPPLMIKDQSVKVESYISQTALLFNPTFVHVFLQSSLLSLIQGGVVFAAIKVTC